MPPLSRAGGAGSSRWRGPVRREAAGDRRSVAVLAARAVDVAVVMRVVLVVVRMTVRMTVLLAVIVAVVVTMMGMVVMPVIVVVMLVAVTMVAVVVPVMVVIVTAGAVVVGRRLLLGAERALEGCRGAALAADQLRHHRVVEDVERVGGHLGLDMVAAELPGEAGEPDRVLGRDREQGLAGGEDAHQAAVLQAHRVAVLQHRRPVEVEAEAEAALRGELAIAAGAGGVVEGDLVGDGVGAHGGFADDGGGALHRVLAGVSCLACLA